MDGIGMSPPTFDQSRQLIGPPELPLAIVARGGGGAEELWWCCDVGGPEPPGPTNPEEEGMPS